MTPIHITHGDTAADSLRRALQLANRDGKIEVMRDDLAVGPLRGIDDTSEARSEFWLQVIGDTAHDLDQTLNEQAAMLEQLASSSAPIVMWHGQSTGDQLALCRLCYHLRNSPQRLNEVRLSASHLAFDTHRADQATAIGMFEPEILSTHIADAAPISILRISRLALEWQEVKQANGETRRWRNNTFTSGSFAELDTFILERTAETWQRATPIVAALMAADMGFLVSDRLAFWRLHGLAAHGRIQLRGDPYDAQTLELCLAPQHHAAPLSSCLN
ncbi:DUF1835 domain-containing protein [Paraburkholderia hayleyella]|uniref:DUF1835 domain-containing protein n=1 Tax=Paraburkholderia hayleyella TaxID=2152889 RepID=UPI001290C05D|nr:DUF1835 domain-containing protein [Paraburkholderia hayleyella]